MNLLLILVCFGLVGIVLIGLVVWDIRKVNESRDDALLEHEALLREHNDVIESQGEYLANDHKRLNRLGQ